MQTESEGSLFQLSVFVRAVRVHTRESRPGQRASPPVVSSLAHSYSMIC
jgi:hypothetical protein